MNIFDSVAVVEVWQFNNESAHALLPCNHVEEVGGDPSATIFLLLPITVGEFEPWL